MTEEFRAAPHLERLKDFQRDTVRHVVQRMYDDKKYTRRFLVADETGLGKSVVARGVIAEAIERLLVDDTVDRIDIVYVCSNADIAAQNLRRLNILGGKQVEFHTRLTMLATETDSLNRADRRFGKPINLIAFTPATSFDRGWATGRVEERAVLFHLLKPAFDLRGARETAALRVLQGGVATLDRFKQTVESYRPKPSASSLGMDPTIAAEFQNGLSATGLDTKLQELLDDIGLKRSLPKDLKDRATKLTGEMRTVLARASVEALEPDLIILDEFQRFRLLLDIENGGEAAELAHELFTWGEARTLLLSATPYKPFTTADEDDNGEGHYEDFLATLRFLSSGDEAWLAEVKDGLAEFRARLLASQPADDVVQRLRVLLLQYMCRTERPEIDGATREVVTIAADVTAQDFRDYVGLIAVATAVDAQVQVEYWKSAPYFVNFLDGYQVGERLRAHLKGPEPSEDVRRELNRIASLDRRSIESFGQLDLGNARLRDLSRRTVGAGWWKLLWIPPSLPYLPPDGPYAEPWAADVTKQLIFSSWTATPTAVAGLLSYEADRHLAAGSNRLAANTAEARRRRATLLDYRVEDGRAAAMSTLAIFWPHPTLARLTDPLRYAREAPDGFDPSRWATDQLRTSAAKATDGSASDVVASFFSWPGSLPAELEPRSATELAAQIAGSSTDDGETEPQPSRLDLHVEDARRNESTPSPSAELAQLAMSSPGNIAWRALGRLMGPEDGVSPDAHWEAAARLANGIRSLFNRAEPSQLLDALYPTLPYWQAVVAYCRAGNLQAVLDEYLHHLRSERGDDALDREALISLVDDACIALSVRPSRYRAFDPSDVETPISLNSRFALRYGSGRGGADQEQSARKPEVRAAFNSPFWPFVLATTSAGQEGIDFHWWCHSVVHWNTPSNPVDFEQREGRVNRFGGHAVRRNIAVSHRSDAKASDGSDPWKAMYDAARSTYPELGDFAPYWIYPGPYAVQRHLLPFPLSRDQPRADALKRDLGLYRLALGQPRQQDLLETLSTGEVEPASHLIDLRPDGRN